MREKRTDVDYSKHEIHVTKHEGITIHHFKQPDTVIYNVKFINIQGILVVTGDLGNWMFCREFVPSAEGYVSDGYWCEKLQIGSDQSAMDWDQDGTREEVEAGINGGLAEYGHEGDNLKEVIEYYKELLRHLGENKFYYEAYAYQNYPSFMDGEDIPNQTKIKIRLKMIFDAFDEMCRRLQDQESSPKEPRFDSSVDQNIITDK